MAEPMSFGRLIRLIAASSRLGGRVRPLRYIELLPAEEDELRRSLLAAREGRWMSLTVEEQVQWGALYLYSFVRSDPAALAAAALFGQRPTPDQLDAITLGRDLWTRNNVSGAAPELDILILALAARPATSIPPAPAPRRASPRTAGSVGRILVRAQAPTIGRYNIVLRAETKRPTGQPIDCIVVADSSEVQVELVVDGQPARREVSLMPNAPWTSVGFAPYSETAERTRLEVHSAPGGPKLKPGVIPGFLPTLRRPAPAARDEKATTSADPVATFQSVLGSMGS